MVQARGIQIRENVKYIGSQVLEQVVRGAYSVNGTGKNIQPDGCNGNYSCSSYVVFYALRRAQISFPHWLNKNKSWTWVIHSRCWWLVHACLEKKNQSIDAVICFLLWLQIIPMISIWAIAILLPQHTSQRASPTSPRRFVLTGFPPWVSTQRESSWFKVVF